MSSTDHHSEGSAISSGAVEGFEKTDFNWALILWCLPISVIILGGFFMICIYSFRGYKDDAAALRQGEFTTIELNILTAKENEALSEYKYLDKEKGKIQIPVTVAMNLLVQENQKVAGADWKPITDIYMEGAAFKSPPIVEVKENNSGISIDEVPPKKSLGAKEKKSH